MMAPFRRANWALVGIGLLFLAAWALRASLPENLGARCFFAVAEAALIGGVADWFAVSALFSKPLGVSWHTALIPRNRERLIRGMASMVQSRFLGQARLAEVLERWPLLSLFIQWVDNGKGKRVLGAIGKRILQREVQRLDEGKAARWCQSWAGKVWLQADLASWLAKEGARYTAASSVQEAEFWNGVTTLLTRQIERQELKDAAAAWAREEYEEELRRHGALAQFFGSMLEATGQINPEEFSEALLEEAQSLLREVREDGQHPVRLWLNGQLQGSLAKLQEQAAVQEKLRCWQRMLAEELDFQPLVASLLQELRQIAQPVGREGGKSSFLENWCMEQLAHYWVVFKAKPEAGRFLADRCKQMLLQAITARHFIVGEIVEYALERLSAERLNRLVEEKVGEDLAWIRINGSLVGGIIGFCLFWALEALR